MTNFSDDKNPDSSKAPPAQSITTSTTGTTVPTSLINSDAHSPPPYERTVNTVDLLTAKMHNWRHRSTNSGSGRDALMGSSGPSRSVPQSQPSRSDDKILPPPPPGMDLSAPPPGMQFSDLEPPPLTPPTAPAPTLPPQAYAAPQSQSYPAPQPVRWRYAAVILGNTDRIRTVNLPPSIVPALGDAIQSAWPSGISRAGPSAPPGTSSRPSLSSFPPLPALQPYQAGKSVSLGFFGASVSISVGGPAGVTGGWGGGSGSGSGSGSGLAASGATPSDQNLQNWEWKLKGTPFRADIAARRVVLGILAALAAHGWTVAAGTNVNPKGMLNDTLLLRRSKPRPHDGGGQTREFFAVSFSGENKVRIIGAQRGVRDVFVRVIRTWPQGVQEVKDKDPACTQIKLRGTPFEGHLTGGEVGVYALMLELMEAFADLGFELVCCLNLSGLGIGEEPESWFFGSVQE